MRKLRIAVIGAGRLGGFHAQKLAAFPDVELVAVADPLPQHREAVAARCNTRAVADYRLLLDQIEAAIIATPTVLHHQVARDCLLRGIHCLVEKPLCGRLAEANELVALAERVGVVLQVGHVERFNPALAAVPPRFGAPKYIEAVRASPFTFRSTDIGVVLDMMIHDIDLALWLAGSNICRIDAVGVSVLGGHEDAANARIEFASGTVAVLSACRVAYETVRRMHLWSREGFASLDFATPAVTVVQPSETLRRRRFDLQSLFQSLAPAELAHCKQHFAEEHLPRQSVELSPVDGIALELRDFVASIREGRAPRVSGAAGRDAVAVAEQILARIHSHVWDDFAAAPTEAPLPPTAIGAALAPHFAVSPSPPPAMPSKEAA
jgi:predicted dehydrogenase